MLKLSSQNNDWSVSPTYPQKIVIPSSMLEKDIEECAKSRAKGRLPLLSYYCKQNGATLWRSSQPKEGIFGRANNSDKKMMKCISDTVTLLRDSSSSRYFDDPKKNQATLHIYDARSKIAAFGNKIKGSGYEDLSKYPFAWLKFCDIGNIHMMRDSYAKLLSLCNKPKIPHWLERSEERSVGKECQRMC